METDDLFDSNFSTEISPKFVINSASKFIDTSSSSPNDFLKPGPDIPNYLKPVKKNIDFDDLTISSFEGQNASLPKSNYKTIKQEINDDGKKKTPDDERKKKILADLKEKSLQIFNAELEKVKTLYKKEIDQLKLSFNDKIEKVNTLHKEEVQRLQFNYNSEIEKSKEIHQNLLKEEKIKQELLEYTLKQAQKQSMVCLIC